MRSWAAPKSLGKRETELKSLKAAVGSQKELSSAQIAAGVRSALQDIPTLFKADPDRAKAKLGEHVDRITMAPQPDGTYKVEGEWDLLGAGFAPQMVAGAGFEPATFGL